MLQNLKADIIYHLTPSDFEMEFNLGGCCRMRLLTEKTEDKKGFINALAKSVGRSRVIMVCGPLFSEGGLIRLVASAIGKELMVADNKKFGIVGNEEILILEGSVPLVSKNGYFGGCLIESGPQAIILLTENKTIRKSIMKNLIHPYIEEICFIPQDQPISSAGDQQYCLEDAQSEENQDDPKYIMESENSPSDTEPLFSEESVENIPFIFDDFNEEIVDAQQEQLKDAAEEDNIYIADVDHGDVSDYGGYDYSPEAEEFNIAMITDVDMPKIKTRGLNIGIFILTIALLFVIAALCFFVFILPGIQGVSFSQFIHEAFEPAVPYF